MCRRRHEKPPVRPEAAEVAQSAGWGRRMAMPEQQLLGRLGLCSDLDLLPRRLQALRAHL